MGKQSKERKEKDILKMLVDNIRQRRSKEDIQVRKEKRKEE